MKQRRVLAIAYYYPPYSGPGATRASKMTKYLAHAGWQSTVLTVDQEDLPLGTDLEIPPSAVHRVRQMADVKSVARLFVRARGVERQEQLVPGARTNSQLLWRLGLLYRNVVCFPDPQVGWLFPAAREGVRLARQLRPDIIFSSSFPNTSHLVGAWVSFRTGIPWVAELRDPWTDNHNYRRMPVLRSVERVLERLVLGRAVALVTVSERWAETLKTRFAKPVSVVPNGYDPADYPETVERGSTFTLVYTGTYYNGKQDVGPLFGAVAALSRSGQITPETFRIRFVGHYLRAITAQAESASVLPFVSVEPPVTYLESLKLQRGASALLLFDWGDPQEKGCYTAKIYEYIGARRPILSIGPHDTVVADLLRTTSAGTVGQTIEEIRIVLEAWHEKHRTDSLHCDVDPVTLALYERQTAANAMADIFNHYAGS